MWYTVLTTVFGLSCSVDATSFLNHFLKDVEEHEFATSPESCCMITLLTNETGENDRSLSEFSRNTVVVDLLVDRSTDGKLSNIITCFYPPSNLNFIDM